MDVDVFYDLVGKSKRVVWQSSDRRELYVLFSISGYTQELAELAKERTDLVLR